MPNHVTTICTVTGSPALVAAFVEMMIVPVLCDRHDDCKASPELARTCANRRHFDFEAVLPMPEALEGTVSPSRGDERNRLAEAETGFPCWYEWSIAKWGTKWNAYGFEERERAPGRYLFRFQTAWSFPEPVFEELSQRFPTLVFDLASFDEGWNFGAVGQIGGRNDFRVEEALATDELYERVYGRKPPKYDENGDEVLVTGGTAPEGCDVK